VRGGRGLTRWPPREMVAQQSRTSSGFLHPPRKQATNYSPKRARERVTAGRRERSLQRGDVAQRGEGGVAGAGGVVGEGGDEDLHGLCKKTRRREAGERGGAEVGIEGRRRR
jgi:hypothetical protein